MVPTVRMRPSGNRLGAEAPAGAPRPLTVSIRGVSLSKQVRTWRRGIGISPAEIDSAPEGSDDPVIRYGQRRLLWVVGADGEGATNLAVGSIGPKRHRELVFLARHHR